MGPSYVGESSINRARIFSGITGREIKVAERQVVGCLLVQVMLAHSSSFLLNSTYIPNNSTLISFTALRFYMCIPHFDLLI